MEWLNLVHIKKIKTRMSHLSLLLIMCAKVFLNMLV